MKETNKEFNKTLSVVLKVAFAACCMATVFLDEGFCILSLAITMLLPRYISQKKPVGSTSGILLALSMLSLGIRDVLPVSSSELVSMDSWEKVLYILAISLASVVFGYIVSKVYEPISGAMKTVDFFAPLSGAKGVSSEKKEGVQATKG